MKTICQSCAMPMKKPEDHGTKEDGIYNQEFCKYCYANGSFTENITLKEQILRMTKLAEEQLGMTNEQALILAVNTIPSLKRWKS